VEKKVPVRPKPKRRLTMQMDELWSRVNHFRQQAVGVALCGSRGLGFTVNVRWSDRDFSSAYAEVLPSKRQRAVGKETGKTSYIERFNCTLRQRLWRLVRKTLPFSQKLENHIGAIWAFIHHYNATQAS
jgi:hypothetical protein